MIRQQNRHALVTGGAGFIGSHLVSRLITNGWSVTVLDAAPRDKRTLLAYWDLLDSIDYRVGDVRESSDVSRAFAKQYHIVFHLAAQPISSLSDAERDTTYAVNVMGTRNIAQAAAHSGARYMILASSACRYGIPSPGACPLREEEPARRGFYYYSESKQLAEDEVTSVDGLSCGVARMENVYGPGDRHFSRFVPGRIRQLMMCGRMALSRSRGMSRLGFLYVDDAVSGLLALGEYLASVVRPGSGGLCVNLGNGEKGAVAMQDLAVMIARAYDGVGRHAEVPVHAAEEPIAKYLDVGRAFRLLRWEAGVDLDAGIANTVKWYREHLWDIDHCEDRTSEEIYSASNAVAAAGE